jgi:hypothetical protein
MRFDMYNLKGKKAEKIEPVTFSAACKKAIWKRSYGAALI